VAARCRSRYTEWVARIPPHARKSDTDGRLSSSLTFFHKFVFPTVCLGGWLFGTLLLVIAPPREGSTPLMFLAALAFGIVFFWRWGFSLKRVVATRSGLLVSNYRREVFIPYEQISGIRQNRLLGDQPITVELRSRTALGSKFVFIPNGAFVLFSEHPAAAFLLARAAAAQRAER
jgi:hypothetical protein